MRGASARAVQHQYQRQRPLVFERRQMQDVAARLAVDRKDARMVAGFEGACSTRNNRKGGQENDRVIEVNPLLGAN